MRVGWLLFEKSEDLFYDKKARLNILWQCLKQGNNASHKGKHFRPNLFNRKTYLCIALFVGGKTAGLADERAFDRPHEECLTDLALGRNVYHAENERVAFVLDRIVHLVKGFKYNINWVSMEGLKDANCCEQVL